jgi:hypothetical protein
VTGLRLGGDGDRASFSGHESFPLRYAWPKKCVDAVLRDPEVFVAEEAMVTLGVGKNMVKSIRHWGLATRIIEVDPADPRGRALRVSALGRMIFAEGGADPFLEDPRTLWLLHWLICSHREKCTTWAWAFGVLDRQAFTREEMVRELVKADFGARATAASLARDIDVFLRTYVPSRSSRSLPVEDTLDGPLVELRLLRERPGEKRYEFVRGPKASLDDVTFGFALLEFWQRIARSGRASAWTSCCITPPRPGASSSSTLTRPCPRLESAEQWSRGALVFDDTAGLRQLLRRQRIEPLAWLRAQRGS